MMKKESGIHSNIFLIHKLLSEDRLLSIFGQIGRLENIDSVHVITTETSKLCDFEKPYYSDLLSDQLGFTPRGLTLPERSVFFKHVLAMSNGYFSKIDPILILEDDVFFNMTKMRSFISEYLLSGKALPYDIIFFGNGSHIPHPESLTGLIKPTHTIHKSKCADSYIITRDAAIRILSDIRIRKPFMPYDWDLSYRIHRLKLNIGWLEPGITWQGSQSGAFKSQIQDLK